MYSLKKYALDKCTEKIEENTEDDNVCNKRNADRDKHGVNDRCKKRQQKNHAQN